MDQHGLSHEEIKARLKEAGWTLTRLADELNVSQPTISIVCQGHRVSDRIQLEVARRIGLAPETIWPKKYQGAPMK